MRIVEKLASVDNLRLARRGIDLERRDPGRRPIIVVDRPQDLAVEERATPTKSKIICPHTALLLLWKISQVGELHSGRDRRIKTIGLAVSVNEESVVAIRRILHHTVSVCGRNCIENVQHRIGRAEIHTIKAVALLVDAVHGPVASEAESSKRTVGGFLKKGYSHGRAGGSIDLPQLVVTLAADAVKLPVRRHGDGCRCKGQLADQLVCLERGVESVEPARCGGTDPLADDVKLRPPIIRKVIATETTPRHQWTTSQLISPGNPRNADKRKHCPRRRPHHGCGTPAHLWQMQAHQQKALHQDCCEQTCLGWAPCWSGMV
jgi:hypothetical protein